MGHLGKLIGAVVTVGTVAAGAVVAGVKSAKKKKEESMQKEIQGSVNINGDAACSYRGKELNNGTKFCVNCGMKIDSMAKFCSGCGAPVGGNVTQTPPPVPPVSDASAATPNKRQQEYVGTVYKCSNCGFVINQTTAVCPQCGCQITGSSAVQSIQEFSNQLMAIEALRQPQDFLNRNSVDPVDNRKLALIKSFPIPNTIDDIREFILLAVVNIDVSLSKNTLSNRSAVTQKETAETIGRTISNAWVSKMKQAYLKAEISFPNDPAFGQIQKIYFEKMKELKLIK